MLVIILKGTWWGVGYAVVLLALEMFVSNAVLPHILPKKLRPPYAVTAAVVLISLSLFGLIGAFIAVPLYATLNIEVRRFLVHRLAKKKLPLSSEAYRDLNSEVYAKAAEAHAEEKATASDEEEADDEE